MIEAKDARDMTNDGTEWRDPRCALQLSMRSPATGKHVPENSKLPTPCICKELQERRLARAHSLPLKSSIEKKRNGQLVSGGDLGDRDGARCRRFFPSETATAHPVLASRHVSNALEVDH